MERDIKKEFKDLINEKNKNNNGAYQLYIKAYVYEYLEAKKFIDIVLKEDLFVSQSPYSESWYAYENQNDYIDWDYKPEGSYRLSDHWNFNEGMSCKTEDRHEHGWAIYRYEKGIYKNFFNRHIVGVNDIDLMSIYNLQTTTRDIIKRLMEVAFVQIDELNLEERKALEKDFERYNLNQYIDSDTLLPGVLKEFKETYHTDVEKLIEENDLL